MAAGVVHLPTADRPLRVAAFDALFARALRAVSRPASCTVRLAVDRSAEGAARELAAREAQCCRLLNFTPTVCGDRVYLDVNVPPAHEAVLDALVTRAQAALRTPERRSR